VDENRDFANSAISCVAHSGSAANPVATAAGSGSGDSVYQIVSGLVTGQTYTVSILLLPRRIDVAQRQSAHQHTGLDTPDLPSPGNVCANGISDYRAWFSRTR
jgi:hypothetical protein